MTIEIKRVFIEFTDLEAEIITHLMRDIVGMRKALARFYDVIAGKPENAKDVLKALTPAQFEYKRVETACNELIPYVENNEAYYSFDDRIDVEIGLHYWVFRTAIEQSTYISSEVAKHTSGHIHNERLLALLDAAQRIERLTGYTLPLK